MLVNDESLLDKQRAHTRLSGCIHRRAKTLFVKQAETRGSLRCINLTQFQEGYIERDGNFQRLKYFRCFYGHDEILFTNALHGETKMQQ